MNEEIAPGYGRMLAEAREAKGLSVVQVAEKLKLTTRQVEALEAEDQTRLPVAVFVRGFIRNYARLVDVAMDSLPAIAEVPAAPTETITAHSEELRFSVSPVRRWLLLPMAIFGVFLVLVAGLYAWLRRGDEVYLPNRPAVLAQSVQVATAPLPPPVAPPPSLDPAATATPVPVQTDSTVPTPSPASARPAASAVAALPPAAAKPAAPAIGNAPAQAGPSHVVQLNADQVDAWVEVVSGDDKRYTRLLRAGEQLTLRGTAPFRLVVGNAATVRLSYDGRQIDLKPHTGDKVARLSLE